MSERRRLTMLDSHCGHFKSKLFARKRKRKTTLCSASEATLSLGSNHFKESSFEQSIKMGRIRGNKSINCLVCTSLIVVIVAVIGVVVVPVSAGRPEVSELPDLVQSSAGLNSALSGSLLLKPKQTSDTSRIKNRINLSAANWLPNGPSDPSERSVLPGPAGRLIRLGHPIRKRAAAKQSDSTRVVGVSGQWIELQCPLTGELQLPDSSSPSNQFGNGRMIVWRKDGVPLNQLNPRQRIDSQNGTLSISSAQSKLDEATYECALTPGEHHGGASADKQAPAAATDDDDQPDPSKVHRFELKLVLAPRLAPFKFPADAQVGMKVVLTCSALEGQQPISFVWLKDNQIIGGEHTNQVSGRQINGNSLAQLHQQQLADKLALSGSSYAERASANGAQSRKSEYVLVLEEPDQQLQSQTGAMITSQQVSHGKQQQQTNAPDGNSEQLLSVLSDSNVRVRQSDDYSILSIEKLELKHSGRYTCSAQNEAARSSHSSVLAINAPPTFTMEPQDGNLVSGQTALLDCAASGQPRPSISWLRARELANNKLWDYVPVYDNLRYTTLPNGSLLISNVTQREQGFYLCSAKNGFGPEMTKMIKIKVHEPARFVAKYRTAEVRIEERANMVCQATGEQPISIEWFDKEGNMILKSDKKFIIDNDPFDGGSGEQAAGNGTLSRLILARSTRADSGHYTCQANNKYGSDKMITNLLVQDVPDKVTDMKVTNVTASTISIRWQVAFSGNSPITSYLVQYQSDDPLDDLLMSASSGQVVRQPSPLAEPETDQPIRAELTTKSSQIQRVPSTASLKAILDALNIETNMESADEAIDRTLVELTIQQSSTHLVVKDLNPYCVYRLRLAGINKIGLGEFSEWIRAKTEEAPPSGAGLKISAAATGPNSIKLSWNPPDRRSWNGQLIGFNIAYRPMDSNFELNKTIEWAPPSLQSLILDNHETLTESRQRARFKLKQQQLPDTSQQQQVNTSASPTNDHQVDEDHSKKSSRFSLRQHLKQLLALQQQELVAHLTNLQRSTTYLIWIQSINNRGLSPQSHAINVRTLDDVPPSAPAIKIQSATPNSITIAWTLLSNFVSMANQYSLFYRRVAHSPVSGGNDKSIDSTGYSSHQLPTSSMQLKSPDQPGQINHLEPNPFIERSINGQQLLIMNAASSNGVNSGFDFSDQLGENLPLQQQQPDLKSASTAFMQQSQQHYQQFVYTLDQLDCGSVYELYMTTRNSVGKSEPSSMITTRTLGEPPLAPSSKSNLFAKIGVTEVTLNLAAWSIGGCPLTHMSLRYKQAPMPVAASIISHSGSSTSPSTAGTNSTSSLAVSWPISISLPLSILDSINSNQRIRSSSTSSSSSHHPGSTPVLQPTYTIKNLFPSTCYDLEIAAYNAAGHTTAQYEFVTSNSNGSRSGFSRKEGVYRLDQRGFPLEDDASQSSSDTGHNNFIIEQQAAFANQTGTGGQLIPVLLMLLCFVCLIVSSTFCYQRIRDSWKSNRRPSSPDSNVGSSVRSIGLNCHQSSPGSIGKASSMWRANGQQFNQQQRGSTTLKRYNQHVDDMDSPGVVHYCARDPNQMVSGTLGGASLMLKQPAANFSQSVSMKDFNLIDSAAHNNSAATLNFKNYNRATSNKTATTLRDGRLPSLDNYADYTHFNGAASSDNHQVCSVYGACKAAVQQNGLPTSSIHDQGVLRGSAQQKYIDTSNQQQCQYSNQHPDSSLLQETSWTNYEAQYGAREQQQQPTSTNYAIPISANTCSDQNVTGATYGNVTNSFEQQQLDGYGQLQVRAPNAICATENSIDACIQHLMSQQYQEQQQQQQQYAMIVNIKPDQHDPNNHHSNQVNLARLNTFQPSTQTNQSLVESNHTNQNSSSSSSGIDSGGAHPDCASTTTGTSHSNASNDGYQLTNPNCGILLDTHQKLLNEEAFELQQ